MAAPYGGDPADLAMQQAHLLMTRKQYHEARVLLTQVKMANPGRPDVESALQEAIDLEARHCGPKRQFDWACLTRDMGPVGAPLVFGLAALAFAGLFGVPACSAAAANGLGGMMRVENKYGFFRTVPISGELGKAGACLAVAVVCFAVVVWMSRSD